jgi:hypothetical protein
MILSTQQKTIRKYSINVSNLRISLDEFILLKIKIPNE